MLGPTDITKFNDALPPPGESAWVSGQGPTTELNIVAYDAAWPAYYEVLADLIRKALGPAVLALDHVGSTSVPGLDSKPIIDVDVTVADGTAELTYVPALEQHGFRLVVREPWWYGHRMLRHSRPACNLHVWSPGCPEAARHLVFRDWLRANPDDGMLYVETKRKASEQTVAAATDVETYNAYKQAVIREIYGHAFSALGLQ